MKIIKRLLGFDIEEIKTLQYKQELLELKINEIEKRLEKAEEELKELRKDLKDKVSRESIKYIERELSTIRNLTEALSTYVLHEKEAQESLMEHSSEENLEEVILSLIRSGYDTPSDIIKRVHAGTGRIYEVLERLQAKKKIRKIKKGKRTHYIIIEEAD